MADDDVHKPKLPGVRTLGDDASEDSDAGDLGVTFFSNGKKDTSMHLPEKETAESPQGKSILGGSEDVFDVGHAFKAEGLDTGTIVTDRKKRETSLTGIFSQAFDEWWGKTSTSLKGVAERLEKLKPEEPPTVEAPEKRKEVILEAAKLTKQVPRDDHHIVVEKLKTLTHDAERITGKPYFIKPQPKPEEAKPSWTHTVQDAGITPQKPIPTLDLRETSIAPSVERKVVSSGSNSKPVANTEATAQDASLPPSAFTYTPPKPRETPIKSEGPRVAPEIHRHEDLRPSAKSVVTPAPKVTPVPVPAPMSRPRVEHSLDLRPETQVQRSPDRVSPPPPPPRPTPPPVPETKPQLVRTVPHPVIRPLQPSMLEGRQSSPRIETVLPEPRPKPVLSLRLKLPKFTLPRFTGLNRSLIFAVIAIGIVLGVGAGFITVTRFMGNGDTETPAPHVVTFQGFTLTAEPLDVPVPTTRESLLALLTQAVTSSGGEGMVQFYPVRTVSKVSVPLSSQDLMPLLAPRASPSFVRQLSPTVMLGKVTTGKNEPFIILKADSFDVGFAGMLAWEPWMSGDLSPFMGMAVTATLVPSSGDTVSGPARFTDALKDNRSIRILYDETGSERLIYAFVNRTLIVITTSSAALSAVIENLN